MLPSCYTRSSISIYLYLLIVFVSLPVLLLLAYRHAVFRVGRSVGRLVRVQVCSVGRVEVDALNAWNSDPPGPRGYKPTPSGLHPRAVGPGAGRPKGGAYGLVCVSSAPDLTRSQEVRILQMAGRWTLSVAVAERRPSRSLGSSVPVREGFEAGIPRSCADRLFAVEIPRRGLYRMHVRVWRWR